MGSKSSTTTTNQNQQATTVPQTPTYAADPVKNYFAGVGNYQQADPYSFVTPVNSLQTDAYQRADGLFQTSGLYDSAANATQGVINSNPTAQTASQTMGQIGNLGNAAQVAAPQLGQAAQATAANAGTAQGVNLGGYNAANLGPAAQAGNVSLDPNAAQAQSQSLLDNLQAYQNPYTQQVVDTTLADMDDNAGRVRAAQQADAARGGAFGGSRYGIAQAATESELARARASAAANLRSNAFNTAAGLSGQDTDRRQQTGMFNTAAQNQRTEYGAGLNAANQQFNAGQNNQYGLARFGAQNDAARYGADANNQASLFNAGSANDFALANSGYQQQTGLANMGAQNQFSLAGADLAQQANLANMQAQNTYGLAGFDAANQMNQFNAGQSNNMSQFNTGQMNDMQMQQRQQQLQAAGLLGDLGTAYGNNYRADLGTQLDLGNSLYNMENIYNQAPLTQLQNVGNLLNPGMIGTVSGNTTTGQMSGVDKTTQSGGLLEMMIKASAQAASAAAMASDRRVKRDIERLGEDPDGLGGYRFNYIWDEPGTAPRYGVMADEVAEIRPWALGPVVEGVQFVNYGEL